MTTASSASQSSNTPEIRNGKKSRASSEACGERICAGDSNVAFRARKPWHSGTKSPDENGGFPEFLKLQAETGSTVRETRFAWNYLSGKSDRAWVVGAAFEKRVRVVLRG
jgi:hypothetical protein